MLPLTTKRVTYLPTTDGCFTGDEAISTMRMASEAGGWNWSNWSDGEAKTLGPGHGRDNARDRVLAKEGFEPMVYCQTTPSRARLEDAERSRSSEAPIGYGWGCKLVIAGCC